MQQNSATLIYDLNTMKGTTESYLKKIAQSFQTVQFQAWKIALSSKSLEKNRKLFWATLKGRENSLRRNTFTKKIWYDS